MIFYLKHFQNFYKVLIIDQTLFSRNYKALCQNSFKMLYKKTKLINLNKMKMFLINKIIKYQNNALF